MTTIATDGQSMAGDGQSQANGTVVNHVRAKVLKLATGSIVGGCGCMYELGVWASWLEGGKVGDCPIQSEEFGGLILNPDGSVFMVDHRGRESSVEVPCAVGTGMDLAIGAMMAGATPGEAVNIACKRDPNSGGRIKIEYLTTRLEEAA